MAKRGRADAGAVAIVVGEKAAGVKYRRKFGRENEDSGYRRLLGWLNVSWKNNQPDVVDYYVQSIYMSYLLNPSTKAPAGHLPLVSHPMQTKDRTNHQMTLKQQYQTTFIYFVQVLCRARTAVPISKGPYTASSNLPSPQYEVHVLCTEYSYFVKKKKVNNPECI